MLKLFKTSLIFIICLLSLTFDAKSYVWISAQYQETYASNNTTRYVQISYPNDFNRIDGLFINGNGSSGDTRNEYVRPYFANFLRGKRFAFIGMKGFELNPKPELTTPIIWRALTDFARQTGHYEITNAPWVLYGFSAGASRAHELVQSNVNYTIAWSGSSGGVGFPPPLAPLDTYLIPTLLCAGENDAGLIMADTQGFVDLNRPLGALSAFALIQGGFHSETNNQHSFGLANLWESIEAIYPKNQCVLNGKITLNRPSESSGWLIDPSTIKSGLCFITNYANYTGNKSAAYWVLNKNVAYVFRSFASFSPKLRITFPPTDKEMWAGTATINVDDTQFLGWDKLTLFDFSTNIMTKVAGQSPSFTIPVNEGIHDWHVLGSKGNVLAISRPVLGYANIVNIVTPTCNNQPITNSPPVILNKLPIVSIINLTNNAVFTNINNISIQVRSSDSDGTIVGTELYGDNNLISFSTTSNLNTVWSNLSLGNHSVFAKVIDNSNAVVNSSVFNFTIVTNAPIIVVPPPTNTLTNAITSYFIGRVRNDYTGWLGFKFTVGTNALTVSSLGRFNHIINTNTHVIKFVNTNGTDVVGGSITINNLNKPINNFVYVNLTTPITLKASTPYYLVCQEVAGKDSWATDHYGVQDTLITTTADITSNGPILSNSSTWTQRNAANTTFEPLNFQYSLTNNIIVPNPIPNVVPKINIVNPTNNSSFIVPQNVTITANATDIDGTIVSAQLFINDIAVDQTTNLPINFVLNLINPGNYKLNINVVDNKGAKTLSAPISITAVPAPVIIAGVFVSPTGSSSGNGSINSPFDLQTALNHPSIIKPGNTIWLRNGTYTHTPQGVIAGNEGYIFFSKLTGTSSNPIIVRSYPGEHAIIDGGAYGGIFGFHANARPTIEIQGAYTWFMDLEITSTSTEARFSSDDSSFPLSITRSDGPYVHGVGIKFINLIIHDVTAGISAWSSAGDFEAYGNVVYNNGWQGTPHTHGHNIYTQNYISSSPKNFLFNFFLNAYQNNVQAYGSSDADIAHYRFFNNFLINSPFLLGGRTECHLQDNQVMNNYSYNSDMALVYSLGPNYLDVIARNNYIVDGMLQLGAWKTASVDGNIIITTKGEMLADIVMSAANLTLPTWKWSGNSYFAYDKAAPNNINPNNFGIENEGFRSFANWKARTGFDNNSSYTIGLPPKNLNVLTKNKYDSNKAFIVIYNWENKSIVNLDISSLGWAIGSKYDLISVQNYYNDVSTSILQTQMINIDMKASSHSIAIPRGDTKAVGPNTFPNFGGFVLINKG